MANEKAETRAFARRQREPARLRQIGLRAVVGEFCDDIRDAAAAQPFFHRPQRVDRTRDAQHGEALRGQAHEVETGGVGAAAFATGVVGRDPERLATSLLSEVPSGKRQRETGRGGEMDGGRGRQFVQRPAGKTAGERGVGSRNTQRQKACILMQPGCVARVDSGKSLPETVQRGLWRDRAHGSDLTSVHVLFY